MKTAEEQKYNREKLVQKLRSGEVEQAVGHFATESGSMCVGGVALHLMGVSTEELIEDCWDIIERYAESGLLEDFYGFDFYHPLGEHGSRIVRLNNEGTTFHKLADIIEKAFV